MPQWLKKSSIKSFTFFKGKVFFKNKKTFFRELEKLAYSLTCIFLAVLALFWLAPSLPLLVYMCNAFVILVLRFCKYCLHLMRDCRFDDRASTLDLLSILDAPRSFAPSHKMHNIACCHRCFCVISFCYVSWSKNKQNYKAYFRNQFLRKKRFQATHIFKFIK